MLFITLMKRKLHQAVFFDFCLQLSQASFCLFRLERVALYLGKRVRRGIVNHGSKDVTSHHESGEKNGSV